MSKETIQQLRQEMFTTHLLLLKKEMKDLDIKFNEKISELNDKLEEVIKEMPALEKIIDKIQGFRGDKGEEGDRGDKGDRGERGLPGKDGLDGIIGRDGKDGKSARDGIDGRDGNKILIIKSLANLPKKANNGDMVVLEDTKEVYIYE